MTNTRLLILIKKINIKRKKKKNTVNGAPKWRKTKGKKI